MRMPMFLIAALSVLPVNATAADTIAPSPQAAETKLPGDGIVGRWKPAEDNVVVAITRSQTGYAGSIVESPEKPSLAGQQMFRGLVFDAARSEWTGEVYAVKKGEFVPAVIRLSSDGFVLTAGKGFFSKKIGWTRA